MSDSSSSRRKFLAAMGVTGLGAGLIWGKTQIADASPDSQIGSTPTPLPLGVKSITGTWFGDIKDADGTVLFQGMATFMAGGGMMTTGQSDITPTEFRGTGHGVWKQDGRHVDNRLLKFIYNENFEPTAIYEEYMSGDMDESGDVFVAEATVYLYDLDGNLITSRTGSITAQRLLVTDSLARP